MYIVLQIFFATRAILKIGGISLQSDIPQGNIGHVMSLYLMVVKSGFSRPQCLLHLRFGTVCVPIHDEST